tara:strand:+ start:232 stop:480 length:249 start_codon:yes stop_codon:yes gene_type:complete
MDRNNIRLTYKGYEISIAQHREGDKVVLSEIALKEDDEWKTALQSGGATVSLDFGKTLDGFAGALGCVIYYIDEIKGEDYAG